MKKLFAIAVLGSVMLVSCKKSSSGSGGIGTGTIQASIGGTTHNFTTGAQATSLGTGTLIITGLEGTSNSFSIELDGNNAITTGTYTASTNTVASLNYVQGLSGGITYSNDGNPSDPISVIVTSISATNIQGTFTGSVFLNGDSNAAEKTVTAGKFNVAIR
jgi:hypothetical protein